VTNQGDNAAGGASVDPLFREQQNFHSTGAAAGGMSGVVFVRLAWEISARLVPMLQSEWCCLAWSIIFVFGVAFGVRESDGKFRVSRRETMSSIANVLVIHSAVIGSQALV
jgi:hypothetical protein